MDEETVKLFRCAVCEREFDEMPADGMHSVRVHYADCGDVDGECGPVYEVEE